MSQVKKIGERVELVRGSLGVSAFADSLGVSRKTVQRWEDGLAIPDGNSLLLLKENFGVDPGWLLMGQEPAVSRVEQTRAPYGIEVSDSEEVALVQTYRQLEPASRTALRNMLKVIANAGHTDAAAAAPKPAPQKKKTPKVQSGERTGKQPKVEDRIQIHGSDRPSKKFTPPKKRGGEG